MAKKIKRISGVGMDAAGAQGMAYVIKQGERFDIDLKAIGGQIEAYHKEAKADGKYSHSGLCRKLGITREILDLWRMGYISVSDEADIKTEPNGALAYCVAMGELAIHQYWEECDKPSVQSKHVKLLEKAGIIGGAKDGKTNAAPPFDLGSLSKYCK